MKAAIQLCSISSAYDILQLFPEKYAAESLFDEFLNISNELDANLVDCVLFDKLVDCSKIMFPIITEGGFCMAFNSLSPQDFYTNE